MKKFLTILVFLCVSKGVIANSLIKEITEAVTNICNRPSDAGKYWDVNITGEGDAKIRLLLGKARATGDVTFTKGEWEGAKSTIENSKNYRECAVDLTPIFIDKFSNSTIERKLEPKKRSIGGISWIESHNGVTVELKSCNKKGSKTVCSFIVEALTDRNLELDCRYNACPAYDQDGHAFNPDGLSAANFSDNNDMNFSVVQGVPIKMTVSYNLYESSKEIPKIKLNLKPESFVFRNMNIETGN